MCVPTLNQIGLYCMKHDAVYLHHILDAMGRIETYIAGLEREAFFQGLMVQDAVVRQLEIIGETSRRLSDDFRDRHAYIPWRAIIGMRNRIAHDYINIDLQVVWEVVRQDLPLLKDQITGLV